MRLVLGELVLSVGLVALIWERFRLKQDANRLTLYFGCAATLYGLRLIVELNFLRTATTFGPGDQCLLVTDGVLEAEDTKGEPFGADRLRECMVTNATAGADHLCAVLENTLHTWSKGTPGQADDITLVTIESTSDILPHVR